MAYAHKLCENKDCDSVWINITCTNAMKKALRKYDRDNLKLCDSRRRPKDPYQTVIKCDECP